MYNDSLYFDDHFQMEMVVNVNVCACAVNTWTTVSLHTYIEVTSDFLVAHDLQWSLPVAR